jgi:hypothetical protein
VLKYYNWFFFNKQLIGESSLHVPFPFLHRLLFQNFRGNTTWSDPRNPYDLLRSEFNPIWFFNKIKLIRPDPRSNNLQSNQNLSKMWKNTICKLIRWFRSDPTLIQSDFFQKVKLTWPVRLPSLPKIKKRTILAIIWPSKMAIKVLWI